MKIFYKQKAKHKSKNVTTKALLLAIMAILHGEALPAQSPEKSRWDDLIAEKSVDYYWLKSDFRLSDGGKMSDTTDTLWEMTTDKSNRYLLPALKSGNSKLDFCGFKVANWNYFVMDTYKLLVVNMRYDAGPSTIEMAAEYIRAMLQVDPHEPEISAAISDIKIYDNALELGKNFFISNRIVAAHPLEHMPLLVIRSPSKQPSGCPFFFSAQWKGTTGGVPWQENNWPDHSQQADNTVNMIIPGDSSEDIVTLNDYKAPYEKFAGTGCFTMSSKLGYSISRADVENWKQSDFTSAGGRSTIKILELLSDNHWIALNKRELVFAKQIAVVMKRILLGACGVSSVSLDSKTAANWREFRFRCIEQIEMSDRQPSKFDTLSITEEFATSPELLQRNAREFAAQHELSMRLTNTPLFVQTISKEMLFCGLPVTNANVVKRILLRIDGFAEEILRGFILKYPGEADLIGRAYVQKKLAFMRFLQHRWYLLNSTPMSRYQAVEKGQTSGSHRGTCVFNSLFYEDVRQGTIESEKLGSIGKGKAYLVHLSDLFSDFGPEWKKDSYVLNHQDGVMKRLKTIENDTSAAASISYPCEICCDKLYPGFPGDCAVTEVACHSLLTNFEMFDRGGLNSGNTLLKHYGTGYIGSENFATAGISFSSTHAQALVGAKNTVGV
ncbi:MAG: hypothetical protein LBF56_02190 [Holosporales bacterium]|jgi:hypothetical protein|nr:hypothetical protein [Holosporales bacterium]